MDSFSLKEQHSMVAEHGPQYSAYTGELNRRLYQAVLSCDTAAFQHTLEQASDNDLLAPFLHANLQIVKFSMVSTITILIAGAEQTGLSGEVANDLRKALFLRLAGCNMLEEIGVVYISICRQLMTKLERHILVRQSLLVRRAIRAIQSNKGEVLSVSSLAVLLGVNRSHLSRQFSQEMGESVSHYLRRVKMEYAEELMKSGLYRLLEISELLGYQDYNHFYRVFSRHYGMSPGEYARGL